MSKFPRGLVVGKFAPLHRGHELLLLRAASQCEELLVISYANPEPVCCSAERRAGWISALFPAARACVVTDTVLASLPSSWPGPRRLPLDSDDAEVHRQFVGDLCLHVLGGPVNAVFTSEDYGDGFAAALTRLFRQDVQHVCVDRARQTVPICGTQIRENVRANGQWLSPVVKASFVPRIAILGGESSGKSTLAEALAVELGTCSVAEYGRELWEARDGHLKEPDLLHIAQTQIFREDRAAQAANGWVVCDTTPLTTLFYARAMFGRADEALVELAERRYDVTILCAPDFPFVQDGTRRDAAFREEQHGWYREQLERRGITALDATGPLEERVASIVRHLRIADCGLRRVALRAEV
jgi:NadR type nicotinamide-nucleotide adenylyltransferase